MATSIMRGSGGSSVKEKRGTCPSSTIKKTPKPLTSPSTLVDKKTSSPRHSNKPVPTSLRPTRTSTLVPKKSSADVSMSKPTSTNKKSYDRPPPVQRAVRGSPTTGARDVKPQRSSSFSPVSQRLYARTSSLKDRSVAPNLTKSRSLKKSGCALSTKEKKAPKSVTCENRPSIDQLTLEDDLDSFDAHEVQSLPEMSEMPDSNEELGDPTEFNWEEGPPNETTFDKIQYVEEERLILVDQVAEQIEEGSGGHQQDEQNKEQVQEQVEKEAAIEEVEPTEEKEESQTKTSQLQGCSAGIGKKDKQDYNEVIEKTATKLMGGKKNKVLALAGAFETVISLQDTKNT